MGVPSYPLGPSGHLGHWPLVDTPSTYTSVYMHPPARPSARSRPTPTRDPSAAPVTGRCAGGGVLGKAVVDGHDPGLGVDEALAPGRELRRQPFGLDLLEALAGLHAAAHDVGRSHQHGV